MEHSSKIPKRWAWHYRALLEARKTLTGEHDECLEAIRVPLERGGEDEADTASERTERDTLLAEILIDEAEVKEIDAALKRIRDGTYGRCELTGQPISPSRLRAIPWTRYSQSAAQRSSS